MRGFPAMHLDVRDETGTATLASALAACVEAGDVVLLEGGLGAGKTTFVRAVAYALGLPEDEPVTSPTFAIVQEYATTPPLLHADLYRLAHEDELLQLGIADRVGGDVVALIEWGLGHAGGLPHVDLVLRIEGNAADTRRFFPEARTPRGDALAAALARAARDLLR